MIIQCHNGQFAECEVLENFQGLCGPRTWTCKLVLEDPEEKDFPQGLQHFNRYTDINHAFQIAVL